VLPQVEPWQDDSKITPIPRAQHNNRRICVIGAIGQEKGFDVLLACARDARRRCLDITYIVVGYTSDDGRLLKLGNVEITGKYHEEEVGALIRRQKGNCAFIPSIWPETWCYALSRAWEAGLHAFAFDIGAPAERIRQNGWGILLRLGMEPGKINDAFTAS
jgi:glycosyltransferase involved in cell wall biosynthesis